MVNTQLLTSSNIHYSISVSMVIKLQFMFLFQDKSKPDKTKPQQQQQQKNFNDDICRTLQNFPFLRKYIIQETMRKCKR